MYRDKLIILEGEVIPPITDSMIPIDFCKNNINNLTTEDIIFSNNKMYERYITEIVQIDWLHPLDEYRYEEDTPN